MDLTCVAADSRADVHGRELPGLGVMKEQAHRIHPDAIIDDRHLPFPYPFELGCDPEGAQRGHIVGLGPGKRFGGFWDQRKDGLPPRDGRKPFWKAVDVDSEGCPSLLNGAGEFPYELVARLSFMHHKLSPLSEVVHRDQEET